MWLPTGIVVAVLFLALTQDHQWVRIPILIAWFIFIAGVVYSMRGNRDLT